MPWAKLCDSAWENRKLRKLSHPAFRLWALGLSYCADKLTDGVLPADIVEMILKATPRQQKQAVDELCAEQIPGKAPLWSRTPDGDYTYHGYFDKDGANNDTREEVLSKRKRHADAEQRSHAKRKSVTDVNLTGQAASQAIVSDESLKCSIPIPSHTAPTELAPPALPRLKKADKEPESPIRRLQLRYAEALAANLGQENAELNWEKAGSIFKAALEKFDEATVRRVLEQFVADREPFLVERAWTIGLFRPRFNQYLAKGQQQPSAPRLASEVLADERARAEAMFAEEQP